MDFTRQLLATQVFVSCIGAAMTYTCSYVDVFDRLHYVYCPHSDCCGPYRHRYCCSYTNMSALIGGVIGLIIFVAIVTAIVSCCCCACCPVYSYRTSGASYVTTSTTPVITVGPDYRSTGPVDVVITDNDPYYREPTRDVIIVDTDTYVDEYSD